MTQPRTLPNDLSISRAVSAEAEEHRPKRISGSAARVAARGIGTSRSSYWRMLTGDAPTGFPLANGSDARAAARVAVPRRLAVEATGRRTFARRLTAWRGARTTGPRTTRGCAWAWDMAPATMA